jgi:hypothetical protein
VIGIIPVGREGSADAPKPHSSRGPGHRPLKAEITGSNPVCGTTPPRHVVVRCVIDRSIPCFLTESNAADPLSEPLSARCGAPLEAGRVMPAASRLEKAEADVRIPSPVVSQPPRLGMSPRRYRGGRPRRRGNARWASTTRGRSAGLTVSSPNIPRMRRSVAKRSLAELGDAIGKPR